MIYKIWLWVGGSLGFNKRFVKYLMEQRNSLQVAMGKMKNGR